MLSGQSAKGYSHLANSLQLAASRIYAFGVIPSSSAHRKPLH
jgi:hypothetical protein